VGPARERVVIFIATDASRRVSFRTNYSTGPCDAPDLRNHDVSCGFIVRDIYLGVYERRYKSGPSSQVRSGLGSVKRDWSANKSQNTDDPDFDIASGWSPSPPSTATTQSSERRLGSLQASLSDRITSSEKLLSSSQGSLKRAADPFEPQPPTKKRVLPASFFNRPQSNAKTLSRSTSLNSRTIIKSKQNVPSLLAKAPSKTTAKITSKSSGSISLSQEQNYILKLAQEGKSLFYTGSAGTGKSVLLREIIKTLHKKYVSVPDAVAVTASTGTHEVPRTGG